MNYNLALIATDAIPADWPEALATIIVAVISWWIGRKKSPRR